MKLELFGTHEQKDIIEIENDPHELGLESDDFSFEGPVHVTSEIRGADKNP